MNRPQQRRANTESSPIKWGAIMLCISCISHCLGSRSVQADFDIEAALINAESTTRSFHAKVQNEQIDLHWFPGNSKFWYRLDINPRGRKFWIIDATTGERSAAFDHQLVADFLSQTLDEKMQPNALPINRLDYADDMSSVTLISDRNAWLLDLTSKTLKPAPFPKSEAKYRARKTSEIAASPPSYLNVQLKFINTLTEPVNIHWMSYEDERSEYATLQPDKEIQQDTYAGHVWVVTDPRGKVVNAYVANLEDGIAIIDGVMIAAQKTSGPSLSSNAKQLLSNWRKKQFERPKITKHPVTITFKNTLDRVVTQYWITPDGKTKKFSDVSPGDSVSQGCWGGERWLIVDKKDRPINFFEAADFDCLLVIDGVIPKTGSYFSEVERIIESDSTNESTESPNERFDVRIAESNIELFDASSWFGQITQLNKDGSPGNAYISQFNWSPNSKYLCTFKRVSQKERDIHYVESSPTDQLQPKLITRKYAKPGDRISQARPRIFSLGEKKRFTADHLMPNPWSIDHVQWLPDSSECLFLYNERGHQTVRVIAMNPITGKARVVVDERPDSFFCYSSKQYLRYLTDSDEIIWMSERSGWNHLYLYSIATGKVKNPITSGNWVVRKVTKVDKRRRQIWFELSGLITDQDPYFIHHARVNFDGSNFTILTEGNGTHSIQYSPDGKYLTDRYSRVDLPPVQTLRDSSTGKLICRLGRADAELCKKRGWIAPESFVAKGRDGKTDIYGVIVRPSNFDPLKKYPVIENIYAGPTDSFVPKHFGIHDQLHEMAELGYIVVKIDGMGTSNRSKAFHDVCWKNLGDSGFKDRVLWIKAAAEKHKFMDLNRVGIYGHSAGGQSAMRGLIMHPDFYKVGVAISGCHDNRMDKIWWNEQWMGWPVESHYEEQSNTTQAHRVEGKLMLIVGELDKNVDPTSTMQVADALVKANKDFELVVIPGGNHYVGSSAYGKRKISQFFKTNLQQR